MNTKGALAGCVLGLAALAPTTARAEDAPADPVERAGTEERVYRGDERARPAELVTSESESPPPASSSTGVRVAQGIGGGFMVLGGVALVGTGGTMVVGGALICVIPFLIPLGIPSIILGVAVTVGGVTVTAGGIALIASAGRSDAEGAAARTAHWSAPIAPTAPLLSRAF